MTKPVAELNTALASLSLTEAVAAVLREFGPKVTLASSLGLEDQVLTHFLIKADPNAKIFVLDTGRLNPETYDVMDATQKKYSFKYAVMFPDTKAVEEMVNQKGINLFYESVENRKACCYVRKVEPLKRALTGYDAWMTGLRREQSVTRRDLQFAEWDEAHNMVKLNLLAATTEAQLWDLVKQFDIPVNALHEQGFPSIGCAPCTRAITSKEDIRAGRWWWEAPESKECGLHVVDGKLVRKQS